MYKTTHDELSRDHQGAVFAIYNRTASLRERLEKKLFEHHLTRKPRTEVMPVDPQRDEQFMRAALVEAMAARDDGEVPVGAVVVHAGRIIGRGSNQREKLHDPTAHAEMLAMTAAAAEVRDWRLEGCTLYVTLEPCVMCAGAIVLARLQRLVFGATDAKGGACTSLYTVPTDERLNHRVDVSYPVLRDECAALLQDFFARQRAMGKK